MYNRMRFEAYFNLNQMQHALYFLTAASAVAHEVEHADGHPRNYALVPFSCLYQIPNI